MTQVEPVTVLRETIERYLGESGRSYTIDEDGDFVIDRGSARSWVRPASWGDGETIVRIWSITNVGMRVDRELTWFLSVESGKLVFGHFSLDESTPAVHLGHTLLGDFLSRRELEEALDAIAATADLYDDLISARFGGRTFAGPEPALAAGRAGTSSKRVLQQVLGVLGLAAGFAAAIAAFRWIGDSYLLALYTFFVVAYLVARGLADVITDAHKVRRALYFLLFPVVSAAVLYGTYELWGRWWLAVLLGGVVGWIASSLLGPLLFPRIHREEQLDTAERLTESMW